MLKAGSFITRHRRLLMLSLMLMTLLVCSTVNRLRLEGDAALTSLPVMRTQTNDASAVMAYIDERDAAYQQDVAALTALINQESLDVRTREDAAAQLQSLVADHTARAALEEALSATSLSPCAAVISGGSLTLVTTNANISQEETALLLTLAAAHAGISAENVRILPSEP